MKDKRRLEPGDPCKSALSVVQLPNTQVRSKRLHQTLEEARIELSRHERGYLHGEHHMGENGGFFFNPRPIAKRFIPDSAMIDDYGTIWDEKRFLVPRSPIEVGTVESEFSKVTPGMACHSMPIKFPGTEIRIPSEHHQFLDAIKLAAAFESAVNPDFDRCFGYIGVDQSKVYAGKQHRSVEKHTDGIQGPRIQPKIPVEHTYLCIDRDPTKVYVQPFDFREASADTHLLTPFFEEQADESTVVKVKPYVITLLDAYSVHQAIPTQESGIRTLIKITFSMRIFDRLGNTHNDLFDYEWERHERPAPVDLIDISK